MFLDNPQTLRCSDTGEWCYVSQGDHCFLVVPGETLVSFGQGRLSSRVSSVVV